MITNPILRLHRNNEIDLYTNEGTIEIVEAVTDLSFESVVGRLVESSAQVASCQDTFLKSKMHKVRDNNGTEREIEGVCVTVRPNTGGVEDGQTLAKLIKAGIDKCGVAHKKQSAGNLDQAGFLEDLFKLAS